MPIEKVHGKDDEEIDLKVEEEEEEQSEVHNFKTSKKSVADEESSGDDAESEEEAPKKKQASKEEAETGDEESSDEEEYSERVQKRINKEVWKRREAERQLNEYKEQLQQLQDERQRYEQAAYQSGERLVTTEEESLNGAEAALKAKFSKAYDEGDTEEMFGIQQQLADIATRKRDVANRKNQFEQYKQQLEQRSQQPQQQPQQPQGPDPKALEWASNNTWFNQDPVKTGAAYALDATLKQEGFDPRSDEFYEELDNRLSQAFPDLRPQEPERPRQAASQPVAGVSRTAKSSKKQTKLSADEAAMAQRLGVPVEVYAQYLRRGG